MRASIDTLDFIPIFNTYANCIESKEKFSSPLHLYFRRPISLKNVIKRGLKYFLAKDFGNVIIGVMVYNKEGTYLGYYRPDWDELSLSDSWGIGNINQWPMTKFVFSYNGGLFYYILCFEEQEIKLIECHDEVNYAECSWEDFHNMIKKIFVQTSNH